MEEQVSTSLLNNWVGKKYS
ncbi:hypothetical protein F383_06584 [Gossypium arboreum]|uniref:Uncharacterized protein n=1 Tax=Gossypium arboreum TaxID=29729 RepID=A0A0B0N9T7_GOSAR|nr:hypothetical protein F383_06584 [Gossypium arboreum]